jgi:hypothetical protein
MDLTIIIIIIMTSQQKISQIRLDDKFREIIMNG